MVRSILFPLWRQPSLFFKKSIKIILKINLWQACSWEVCVFLWSVCVLVECVCSCGVWVFLWSVCVLVECVCSCGVCVFKSGTLSVSLFLLSIISRYAYSLTSCNWMIRFFTGVWLRGEKHAHIYTLTHTNMCVGVPFYQMYFLVLSNSQTVGETTRTQQRWGSLYTKYTYDISYIL